MNNPTPAEIVLLQRTANLVSGTPISAVSKQFVAMLREHVNTENADLRGLVKWAYDAGFTPKTMSRDMHRKLAGLSPL